MASVARSLLVASKATRVLNAASVRSFSRSPVAGAEVDVVQKLYINELKKVAEEQKKKPSPEKEILAQITAQREARQKDAAAKEAAYKKEVEAALKEYAEYEAKTKEAAKKAPGAPAAAATATPEVTREDNKRIFLLKQFGFPETADLTVVAPAFLKKLGENALAAAIKAYRAEVESLTSQGQWVAVPSIPNIRKLAEQLNKVGIPAGADLFVAVRLSKQEWVDDEVAILANDLIKEDIREVERKRIIDRIMVLVVLEHTEEEQELLKLVGSKTETAIDTAAAEREIELARLGAAFEAKKKLYLSKIGFPTDDDLASAAAAVAKSDH